MNFEQLDRGIFTALGHIDSEDQLRRTTYCELDHQMIRQWRDLTKQRASDAFQTVIADRDSVMAGHLTALTDHDDINTVVAAVGVQHLTGVLNLLRAPSKISDDIV